MTGTLKGGKKAAATNRRKYGADFYGRIGQLGGQKGRTGGFYKDSARARAAGAKGGRVSKRGKAVKTFPAQIMTAGYKFSAYPSKNLDSSPRIITYTSLPPKPKLNFWQRLSRRIRTAH